jgi:hypothetical protein
MRAATPPHRFLDPDEVPYTTYTVWGAYLLTDCNQPVVSAPCCGAYGLHPYTIIREDAGSVLFAPGFNPMGVPWWLWDNSSSGGFWGDYHANKSIPAHSVLDEGYRKAAAALAPSSLSGKETFDELAEKIRSGKTPGDAVGRTFMVPLYSVPTTGGRGVITINHSLLIFLVNRQDVWADLQSRYKRGRDKEAITIICKSIAQMVKAHDEKWPSYAWTPQQKRVIAWCNSVADGGANAKGAQK